MAFILKKIIELSSFGDDWKDCNLVFTVPTYGQIKEFQKKSNDELDSLELIESLFVSGKAFDGTQIVELNKDDLAQLPVTVLLYAFQELSGQLNPKADAS